MMRLMPIALSAVVLGLAACEETTTAADPDAVAAPATDAAAEGAAEVAAPASLTADERTIWNSLTPSAKAQAAEFIANGGTLTQFVSL